MTAGNPSQFTDGPRITTVSRYGIHWMPTTVVLSFNQPLDPASAQDVTNYIIIDPHGHRVPISSAVYDPATLTVTLHPCRRLNFHYGYKLTVIGTAPSGLTDTQGLLLDGNNDGKPGGNFVTVLNRHNLVLGVPTPKATHHFASPSRQRSITRPQNPNVKAKAVVVKSASKLLGAALQKDSALTSSHGNR